MIRAFHLLFAPFQAWERITLARRGMVWVLLTYLFPMLICATAFEGYSLMRWGEKRGEFDNRVKISEETAIRYSVAQLVLLSGSIFVGAKVLEWITHSFNVDTSYRQCFSLMAYGFTPIILARFLDALPAMNTWACWLLGVLVASSLFYHGVGLMLRPEQTKGFGLYLVSLIVAIASSGCSHFVALSILHGKVLP